MKNLCASLVIVLGFIVNIASNSTVPMYNIEDVKTFETPLETDLSPVSAVVNKLATQGGVVITLGDSLMAFTNGYKLQSVLQSVNPDIIVDNSYSMGGATACYGSDAMENIINIIGVDLVIVSFAVNDSYQIQLWESQECWEDIVEKAIVADIPLMLLSEPMHMRSDNVNMLAYSEILQQLYLEHSELAYINGHTESWEVIAQLPQEEATKYFSDGLHLSPTGISLMGDIISDAFNAELAK